MIFAAPEHAIRFITGITSVGEQPEPESSDSLATFALVRVKREDESDHAWRDYGIKPLEEAFDIPAGTERDVGLLLEVTPLLGGDVQALDTGRRQYAYFPSTYGDQKPKIFLCGTRTPKRVRIGVMNFNRFAVLRRVQICAASDFDSETVFQYDIYYDWPGVRIPAPIPNEFLVKRTSTEGGATLYVRVAHSITLQSQLSAENPLSGFPVYIYGRKPVMGPWSDVLTLTWPETPSSSMTETPGGIADFVTDFSGLQTSIGLKVIHPGATEYVDESIIATGLLDGAGIAGRLARWADEDSLEAAEVGVTNEGVVYNVALPINPTDAANKQYVDAVATGLDLKASVRAATTASITLGGEQTIDGVEVVEGDRVLVKNQNDAQYNGIYIVNALGGWARSQDADSNDEVTPGMFCFVEEGSVNADTGWVLITNAPIVLDATELAFTQFNRNFSPATINFVMDGGGSAITTGSKGVAACGFACEILSATLLADQAGSIVCDVKKASYDDFPTTVSICASAKPTLSSAVKSQDSTLTGWTTVIAAGDVLEFVVDSATDVERVTLALQVRRI